jgi:hypothetical protein
MADDLERGLIQSSVAQIFFSFLNDSLLRAKIALSQKRKMTWPFVAVGFFVFALFSWWAGIQIHAYYIYKAYGLTWFENQLPSIAEVSGKDLDYALTSSFVLTLRCASDAVTSHSLSKASAKPSWT